MKGQENDQGLTDSDISIGWVLGVGFLLLFLCSPNLNTPNGDTLGWVKYIDAFASDKVVILTHNYGTAESTEIEISRNQIDFWAYFNPHHLLYLPVTSVAYYFAREIFPDLQAGAFLRFWNSLFSTGIIVTMFFILRTMFPGSPWVLPWVIFTGTSVTFFRYATDGSQYMTALFFLLLASSGVVDFIRTGKPQNLVQTGTSLAIAALFHQIVAILVPFLLIGACLIASGFKREGKNVSSKWLRSMIAYALGIPVFVYLVVAYYALSPQDKFTPSGIFYFATLYARVPDYWNLHILEGLRSTLVASIGFYFGSDRAAFLLFKSVWFTALAMVLPAAWLLGLLSTFKLSGTRKLWLMFCLFWLVPLFIFLCFWNPGHEFYHLFLMPPLMTLAVLGTATTLGASRARYVALACFWIWIILAIVLNLPSSLEGSPWRESVWLY